MWQEWGGGPAPWPLLLPFRTSLGPACPPAPPHPPVPTPPIQPCVCGHSLAPPRAPGRLRVLAEVVGRWDGGRGSGAGGVGGSGVHVDGVHVDGVHSVWGQPGWWPSWWWCGSGSIGQWGGGWQWGTHRWGARAMGAAWMVAVVVAAWWWWCGGGHGGVGWWRHGGGCGRWPANFADTYPRHTHVIPGKIHTQAAGAGHLAGWVWVSICIPRGYPCRTLVVLDSLLIHLF
ncbi:hypothetical protein K439DRAFT_1612198 [Ramaria rubella]|nr:hypothetical protein K439DRAFT_1612198 [Ramaria rubella]